MALMAAPLMNKQSNPYGLTKQRHYHRSRSNSDSIHKVRFKPKPTVCKSEHHQNKLIQQRAKGGRKTMGSQEYLNKQPPPLAHRKRSKSHPDKLDQLHLQELLDSVDEHSTPTSDISPGFNSSPSSSNSPKRSAAPCSSSKGATVAPLYLKDKHARQRRAHNQTTVVFKDSPVDPRISQLRCADRVCVMRKRSASDSHLTIAQYDELMNMRAAALAAKNQANQSNPIQKLWRGFKNMKF